MMIDVLGFTPLPRQDCPRDPIPALFFECASQTTGNWGLSLALGDHVFLGVIRFGLLCPFLSLLGRRSLPPSLACSLDEIIAAILVAGRVGALLDLG